MAKRPDSSRGTSGYHDRRLNLRTERRAFLIVCQGAKTESIYFDSFPWRRSPIKLDIKPLSVAPLELVERAAALWKEGDYRKGFDQAWCVFDRDETPATQFNDAIALARQKGINVAYSNEAFELWYLLHFQYVVTALSRKDLCDKLSSQLERVYKKNDFAMYARLLDHQPAAIANTERLMAQYDGLSPADENPSTTVHLLVKEMNRFLA
jgi:hypothetical protein